MDDELVSSKHHNLEDIARLSGVSRSTVSRVINQHPNVSEKTRQRVLQVIDQVDFHPNLAARALVTQKLNVIGILIPHIVSKVFSDPFFPLLLQSITNTANQMGYSVTLWLTSTEGDSDNILGQVVNHRLIDGLIVASTVVDEPFIQKLDERGKPFVIIGSPNNLDPYVNYVDVENEIGAYRLTQHLIKQQRRRIAHIPGLEKLRSSRDRQTGYLRAIHEAGLEAIIAPPGNFSEAGGYRSMQVLLDQQVDAVFCASDIMAIGAMRAIRAAGFCVPDDIAVGGFDDIHQAALTNPPLTTVHQPILRLGEVATEGIISILDGRVEAAFHQILPVELIIRQSA